MICVSTAEDAILRAWIPATRLLISLKIMYLR